jgi:hypothetical protein
MPVAGGHQSSPVAINPRQWPSILYRQPDASPFTVAPLHGCPGNAEHSWFAAAMLLPGVVEGLAKNILCMHRQMIPHRWRQFIVPCVRHGEVPQRHEEERTIFVPLW